MRVVGIVFALCLLGWGGLWYATTVDLAVRNESGLPFQGSQSTAQRSAGESYAAATEEAGPTESQVIQPMDPELGDEKFDPAAEVTYAPHPELQFEVIEELDSNGHSVVRVEDSSAPVAPIPVLAVETIRMGVAQPADPGAQANNDYDFPTMTSLAAADEGAAAVTMTIPDQPVPGVSTRRLLKGGEGEIVSRGSKVNLRYDMYSWSTGELVDSSSLHSGGVLPLTLGGAERRIPGFVEQSLLGRTAGSRVQVVLGKNTKDLPDHLNSADGYVLVVDISERSDSFD